MKGDLAGDPLDELPSSIKKEQFSRAYVHLVASAAGFSIRSHATDVDGVDITVVSSAQYETRYCPQFDLQLKCTSQRDIFRDEYATWRMEAGPFRRLTNPKRYIPAYLAVLVVPADPELWLDQDEDRLITASRMYWQRAADLGELREGQQTKTVYLPRSNLFDVPQLRGIMKSIGEGGEA